MQSAAASIVLVAEFSASMQSRQDDFQRRFFHLRMFINRNPATVILHGA